MDFFLLAQAAPPAAPSIIDMVWPLGLIFLVFYFVMWRPQAKRQREHDEFLNALKSGDEIVTSGGIIGTIRSIDDKVLTLEVSKGTKIKVLKSQVRGSREKLAPTGEPSEKSDKSEKSEKSDKSEKSES